VKNRPRDIDAKHALIGEGWRKLEDDDVLMSGDETACVSTLFAGREQWGSIEQFTVFPLGKTVAFVCDEMGDMDGQERIFRRNVADELTQTAQGMGMYGSSTILEEVRTALELILHDVATEQSDGTYEPGDACNQFVTNIASTALRHVRENLGAPAVFIPPMWVRNGGKVGQCDLIEDRVLNVNPYWRIERLRLRESAEDSTCTIVDVDAPEQVTWAGKTRRNRDKRVHVSVAYVLERFGPLS
jgi:hypothetical protein